MHITQVLCLNDGTGGKPAVAIDVLPGAGSKSRNCRQDIGRKPPQCEAQGGIKPPHSGFIAPALAATGQDGGDWRAPDP